MSDRSLLPLGEHTCSFAHWYNGIGHARYYTYSNFKKINHIHHQLHEQAGALVDCLTRGRGIAPSKDWINFKRSVLN
ncbi:MAG: CZB domain-containing protein [Candidatus Thiodiazotropha taylori]